MDELVRQNQVARIAERGNDSGVCVVAAVKEKARPAERGGNFRLRLLERLRRAHKQPRRSRAHQKIAAAQALLQKFALKIPARGDAKIVVRGKIQIPPLPVENPRARDLECFQAAVKPLFFYRLDFLKHRFSPKRQSARPSIFEAASLSPQTAA